MTIQACAAFPWSVVVSNTKFDMWSSIQETAARGTTVLDLPPPPKPYVHPMMRRSASSLSQKSLEVCTESLGSETGSDGCLSDDCFSDSSSPASSYSSSPCHSPAQSVVADDVEEAGEDYGYDDENELLVKKELLSVNYHCSIGRRSPTRSFPPPLPSISRRDGPCVQMRSHRRDGRLVLEAVPVPSQNYLHCRRAGGRLLLTFIEPTFEDVYPAAAAASEMEEQEQEEEHVRLLEGTEEVTETEEGEEGDDAGVDVDDDDLEDSTMNGTEQDDQTPGVEEAEEEVEVVDRGIVVEVKVSRQPQPLSGGLKVRRSSLVINKFVGGVDDEDKLAGEGGVVRAAAAAAAAVTGTGKMARPATHVPQPQRSGAVWSIPAAEASISSGPAAPAEEVVGGWGTGGRQHVCPAPSQDNSSRLLCFTSKNPMNRQALLHQVVRRCRSDPHRPLFITEPCCIAPSKVIC